MISCFILYPFFLSNDFMLYPLSFLSNDFMHYPLMVFESTWALKHMAGVALIDPDQADPTKESKLALVLSCPLPII